MAFRLLADLTMLLHLAYLVFVVLGGYLALWWRTWVIVPHVLAAGWGFATVLLRLDCPLTWVENWAREQAGQEQLPAAGFIDHYLEGVVYPAEYTLQIQVAAALLVVVSWVLLWRRVRSEPGRGASQGRRTTSSRPTA